MGDFALPRAARYKGLKSLIDLGCSIGGDTLALAQIAPTTGVDIDPLRLEMARANMEALGWSRQAGFVQADLQTPLPFQLNAEIGLFFDPARRTDYRRVFSVRDYQPALSIIQDWLPDCPNLGVKISPGVQLEELNGYSAEVEFISLQGELKRKRALVWELKHCLTPSYNPTRSPFIHRAS